MSRLFLNTGRYILRILGPFGMAESTTSETSSEATVNPPDTRVFNEFIPGNTPSDGTRQGTSEDDSNKKAKPWNKPDFENMSVDEKRFYYRCENDFLTLEHILSWPDYVKHNQNLFTKEGFLSKHDKFHDDYDKINSKISLWQGDITCLEIDAIVNAANTSLLGGGGVDGCIHRAAGKGLLKECKTLYGCKTGQAKITSGYRLPAKKVIHTVGPMGENKKKLQSCYKSCLELVKEHNLRTVAFCCISTGIYGYPYEQAAIVAVETVKEWLEENKDEVDRVIFCVFLEDDLDIYQRLMLEYFPCTVAVVEEDDDKGADSGVEETETTKGDEKVKKTIGDDDKEERDFPPKPPEKAQSKEDVGSSDSLEESKMQVDISDREEGDGVEKCAENSGLIEATENDDVEGNSPKTVDEKVEEIEADREMKKRKWEGDVEAMDVEASEVHREEETLESGDGKDG